MRLETPRLIIRTYEPRDAEPWIAMVNDPEVTRYTPPGPPATLETFQASMARRHEMERAHGYAVWAVDAKESGTFVGQCGLYPAEQKGPEVELAYHYSPASWGKGYATEAATAVLAYALGPLGLNEVIAFVMPANVASCRVVEKAGMRLVGAVTVYDISDVRKYLAERAWWRAPQPG
jgi:RimJ/RimL family protein N-acetyltransferase